VLLLLSGLGVTGEQHAGRAVGDEDGSRELSLVSEKSSLGGLAPKLLQLEGGCHRRVVERDILLPLDRILPYEGKSVYKIDVADDLR
jgi:hypothetical protein